MPSEYEYETQLDIEIGSILSITHMSNEIHGSLYNSGSPIAISLIGERSSVRTLQSLFKLTSRAAIDSQATPCSIRPSHNLPFPSSLASLLAASPSTSTHQPSGPPPSPPTPALNSLFAYSNPSSSKLPGCNHTAGTPAALASRSTSLVIAGGVMTLKEVSAGYGSAEGDGIVG